LASNATHRLQRAEELGRSSLVDDGRTPDAGPAEVASAGLHQHPLGALPLVVGVSCRVAQHGLKEALARRLVGGGDGAGERLVALATLRVRFAELSMSNRPQAVGG
jgi:hypothetical protein